jgi:hypothetical protein
MEITLEFDGVDANRTKIRQYFQGDVADGEIHLLLNAIDGVASRFGLVKTTDVIKV